MLRKVLDGVVDGLHHGDRITLENYGFEQPGGSESREDLDRLAHGVIEPPRQLFARETAARSEFGPAIAHVGQPPSTVTDPLPHVAAKVEDQVADGVFVFAAAAPDLFIGQALQAIPDPGRVLLQLAGGKIEEDLGKLGLHVASIARSGYNGAMRILVLLTLCSIACLAQRKTGNPLDSLPPNIEILTYFGERADISPDNQRVAFMAKSFGDAMVIDLKTRIIRCLTCNVPGAAFLRVMHLVTGDYLLIGPERFQDIRTSRSRDNELWFLSKQPGSRPVRLNQKMSEGAAVSKRSLKIGFAETSAQFPEMAPGSSRLVVAELDLGPSGPRLVNRRVVFESKDRSCVIEAQDFFDNDRRMTFTCYEPNDCASVMVIDLETGQVQNHSQAPGTYNEPEGIFPDGLHTLVEADRQAHQQGRKGGFREIDLWKLRLDGTGKDFVRLTYFNDYEGYKASNGVVSTDGRFMAFQLARTADEAGVGYGILLYWFRK